MGINLHLVDASELFLTKLAGVTDPETKRKIIGNTFIEVFDEVRTMLYYIDMYMYMSFERLWVWVAGCLAIESRVMGLRKSVMSGRAVEALGLKPDLTICPSF